MTSEVLMLNRDAVVIAADSALTTGRDPHPRYSKSANKIFDLCVHGNVAVTIYDVAELDRVPWGLALKLFRTQDAANPPRPVLVDYIGALVTFLQGNSNLFPPMIDMLHKRFTQSAVNVLQRAGIYFPVFADLNAPMVDRTAAWTAASAAISQELAALPYEASMDLTDYQAISALSAVLEAEFAPSLAATPTWSVAVLQQLSQLAIENLVKRPSTFMDYTGLVFSGYGGAEIFPSFFHICIYGHVGSKLLWSKVNEYKITHDNDAMIQPFAKSSMIERFTDGFDYTLRSHIHESSRECLQGVVADVVAGGIAIPQAIADAAIAGRHTNFMNEWQQKNWADNFHPLRRVLNSLSVPEMAHLAESLLVLEALRERVTSPSETVGGPIDVAVITKAEGLVWLKRKHFFEPQLNLRYLNRIKTP